MKGYPKHLNTKDDYLYVVDNFERSLWEQDVKNLLDTKDDWFVVGPLETKEAGIEDATHRIVEEEGEEGTSFVQYELRENPTAKIFRLGFTVEEVQSLLGDNA